MAEDEGHGMSRPEGYFRYWGKADPSYQGEPKWHPLVYHCLDVAAVAQTYLTLQHNLLASLSANLKTKSTTILDIVSFLASFHDIGKMSKPFQESMSKLEPYGNEQLERRPAIGHVIAGCRIWNELSSLRQVREKIGLSDLFDTWVFSSLAHHGYPPRQDHAPIILSQYFPKENRDTLLHFVDDLATFFVNGKMPELGTETRADYNHVSWIIAGIIIVSDWIGSNPTWFRYTELLPGSDNIGCLKRYWHEKALPSAHLAIEECKLMAFEPSNKTGMRVLFPSIKRRTALQTLVESVVIDASPSLFVIEDATGTGKTEAAIVLAHRLMMAGRGDGIYFALPTMATSNRMYERILKVYRHLYDPGQPSIVLAHSAGKAALTLERHFTEQTAIKEDSLAECSEWIADSRKKALLAHVGVGTIDQALMGALRIRHQSMRLLGLSRKILIIDEVHACEPYVLELLSQLLTYHSTQGGSAILLSATIPTEIRQKLVNAYARGLGEKVEDLNKGAFPLVTYYGRRLRTISVDSPAEAELDKTPSYRPVRIKAIHSVDEALEIIRQTIKDGKCICWIRNTVIDALDAYEKCIEYSPILFHARFTLGDRLRIGLEVENRFGLKGSTADRYRKLVIATQVIEQSLDVDFDVIITDLSPIDSVIQRSGRLHRHRIRDERILYVLMPNPDSVINANWYSSMFPRASRYVYPHWGHLWLTARWLKPLNDQRHFRMPFDAREMIEFVYGGHEEFPGVLMNAEDQSFANDANATQIGRLKALVFEEGYSPEGWKTWLDDESAPTRLGAPTSTVVLCRRDADGHICPIMEAGEHGWDASSVTVRSALIHDQNPADKEAIEAIKTIRKQRVFIIMSKEREVWKGCAVNKAGKIVTVEYSHTKGLQVL
jgi:CRISPR-associated endonuclease/helicase Cas3